MLAAFGGNLASSILLNAPISAAEVWSWRQAFAVILKFAKQAFVFVVCANPEPEISLRDGHGQGAMAAAKTSPPKAAAFLKTQGTVLWISLPKPVGFAGGVPGVG